MRSQTGSQNDRATRPTIAYFGFLPNLMIKNPFQNLFLAKSDTVFVVRAVVLIAVLGFEMGSRLFARLVAVFLETV